MKRRIGAALVLTATLAFPVVALARGGHGGGFHGGGFGGGGGFRGGGGGFRGGGGMAAPRMAAPAYHGGAAAGGFRGYGGAGNAAAFHHGPSLNYSRGYSGAGVGGRGNLGGFNNANVNHNFGMGRQTTIGNRNIGGNAIGNRNIGGNAIGNRNIGGNAIGNRTVVNNNVNSMGNWHRGYWNGHWGGYGGNWGNYGRGGYGGLGYGGYGGLGYGGLGYGGFGSGLLYGMGSGLGFGLGYGLLGGYGMGGYGGYGMGGYGGYGMGGYGGYGGYGSGMAGWGLPSWGLGTWPYSYGYSSYANPYYTSTTGASYLNYGQPIAVDSTAQPEQSTVDTASTSFASARDAFKAGNYPGAQQQAEQALKVLPNDVDLHEFRALTLFAQGRYSEAAAGLYAVLTAGPGWNWATLVGLYPSVDTFTTQLRGLEQYCTANSNAASARFVLSYLYITMGSNDAGAKELREVVRLQPDDRLARQLLTDVSPPSSAGTPTAASASPAAPAPVPAQVPEEPSSPPPSDLTGTWKAKGAGSTAIDLKLEHDGHFTWTTTGQGAPKSFSGTYTTGSGLLTMVSTDGLAIVGRLAGEGDGRFHFKLVGGGPGDPGLTFAH